MSYFNPATACGVCRIELSDSASNNKSVHARVHCQLKKFKFSKKY